MSTLNLNVGDSVWWQTLDGRQHSGNVTGVSATGEVTVTDEHGHRRYVHASAVPYLTITKRKPPL